MTQNDQIVIEMKLYSSTLNRGTRSLFRCTFRSICGSAYSQIVYNKYNIVILRRADFSLLDRNFALNLVRIIYLVTS